ncbi:hypothetical protein [Synechococcus sp. UW140]|uniref:hypothetical protein n=1 Tax=Synechococcus sp. UW140 TaxID=368503 RepID=UPI0031382F4D
MARQSEGNETWKTLREWLKQSAAAERLAGLILLNDGFSSVDPSHPLGGRDGIKDIVCFKDGKKWVAGAYFPRGQKSLSDIKEKFLLDSRGKERNQVDAFAFVTNQELKLSERDELQSELDFAVEIYHLERISLLLNSPSLYGVRLEFLDIEMSKEEQLAFIADRDKLILDIQAGIARIEAQVDTRSKATVVSPHYESTIASFLTSRKLVKCKHCGYGFLISRASSLLGMTAFLGKAYFTCPSCGHVEEAEKY